MKHLLKPVLSLIILTFVSFAMAEEFPLRPKYPNVKPISTEQLAKEFESVLIVDVRSTFEYNVIHIRNSKHNAVAKMSFGPVLDQISGGDKGKKIAFYCNGHTCAKSYKAAKKAVGLGYTNVFAYDAGIFDWTSAHPAKANLMGESPVDPAKIISKDSFKKRLLSVEEFRKGAESANAFIVDVRDPEQRKKSPTYSNMTHMTPLDKFSQNLSTQTFKDGIKGKTLYIFDATGKQVRWLQYHLEKYGYTDYYFLNKGVWGIYGDAGAN